MSNRFQSNIPSAKKPIEGRKGTVRACIHCGKDLVVRKWDDWNGFLVVCPHCKKIDGKHWNKKAILYGSFFVNAASYFFTMRPLKALMLTAVTLIVGIVGYQIIDFIPQPFDVFLVTLFLFMPMLINGMLIVIHEKQINHTYRTTKENALSLFQEVLSYSKRFFLTLVNRLLAYGRLERSQRDKTS
jgi:hypothetical protein